MLSNGKLTYLCYKRYGVEDKDRKYEYSMIKSFKKIGIRAV